nr:hypothetical protein [Tanacetum cinerariifolium]
MDRNGSVDYQGSFRSKRSFFNDASEPVLKKRKGQGLADIEGIPLKLWSESTFNRIAAKWGKRLYLEKLDEGFLYSFIKEDFHGSDAEKEGDNNVSMVPDLVTEDANVQAEEKGHDLDVNNSLDPFELYPLLNKRRKVEEKMDKLNGTTKMEHISLIDVKCCWGNYDFDGVNLLIISVYAPQEYAEKKTLWDYLVHVISKWDEEVIVMGDFNEVRFKNERFGSLFHAHGADAFNRFIFQANLQEIPLGGCSFTWCHRSAKKMSKLDRFLMPKGLLGVNPNFSTLTLDRMYHYWFKIDGFNEMISKAWCECPIVEAIFHTKRLSGRCGIVGLINLRDRMELLSVSLEDIGL